MNRFLITLLAGAVMAGAACASNAVTFAQFFQKDTTQTKWTWNGVSGGTSFIILNAPLDVSFNLSNAMGGFLISGATLGSYDAQITFFQASFPNPAVNNIVNVSQDASPFDGFTIVSTTPGPTLGKVLLAGSSNGGQFTGVEGETAGSFKGSEPLLTVNFTSDVIDLSTAFNRAFSFAYTSVNPPIAYNDNGTPFNFLDDYINSFTASGTGTFSAQQLVPEPSSLAMLIGMGVSGSLVLRRRIRRSR